MKKYVFLILFIFSLSPLSFSQTKIKSLTIQGNIINPVSAGYIENGLKSAEEQEAIFILNIDTPGGLLKSTQEIVKSLLNSSVATVVYVHPKGARAASAGVFIGYAANILAMSPSTHIGAAHPVVGAGSWGKLDEETKKKIINDTLAWAKNIAQTRGRPYKFIKESIEESTSITEEEALKKKVIDFVAQDFDELIEKLNGRIIKTKTGEIKISTEKYTLEKIGFTTREKILDAIINPNIAYLLFTLGFLGLIFEVTHPGFGFPGIAGVICLILAFYAFSVLPLNYAGLVLIILGIIFFIAEALTPAFGLFTFGGVAAFFLGSIMLFNQPQSIKVSFKFILPLIITFSLFSLFILTKALATIRLKPRLGSEALIGEGAIVLKTIKPDKPGKIFLKGEIWQARASERINKNQQAIITGVSGLVLEVKKKEG